MSKYRGPSKGEQIFLRQKHFYMSNIFLRQNISRQQKYVLRQKHFYVFWRKKIIDVKIFFGV